MEMKNSAYAFDFLFGHHNCHQGPLPLESSFATSWSHSAPNVAGSTHATSSFPGIPGLGGLLASVSKTGAPAQPPAGENGYNQFPGEPVKGINPATEIARINGNIALYNGVIAVSAVALGVTMCLFVRSVMKPAKGAHGGDSDEEMDSDADDDSDSDDD